MARKLEMRLQRVNKARAIRAVMIVLIATSVTACGPAPRPVSPGIENGWPTVLGNARRAGFENEVVPDSLDVAWDIDAGTGLRGSLLVTDSAIFTGTTNRQLLAFNTVTGARYWVQRLEGEIGSELMRSGRTLFMTTSEWKGRVHARDVERGRNVWRRDIGPTRNSPVVEGGIVYVASDDGHVLALRSEDGDEIWSTNLHGRVASTPVSNGDALIVGTVADTLYRIAKHDGAIVSKGMIASSISAPPAASGDTLVIATQSGAVSALDAHTFDTLWSIDTGAPIVAAPVIGSDGTVHVLNRKAEIWRVRNAQGTRIAAFPTGATSSFTLARGRYVVGLIDGTLLILDMDGRVIAQHTFNDAVAAPVSIHDRALYVPLLHGRIVKLQ